jgi:hypothetical protein
MLSVSLTFSTKAETLERLRGEIQSARIAPIFFFKVADWYPKHLGLCVRVRSVKMVLRLLMPEHFFLY